MPGPLLLSTINGWWRALLSIRSYSSPARSLVAGCLKVLGWFGSRLVWHSPVFFWMRIIVMLGLSFMFFLRKERSSSFLLPKHFWDFLSSASFWEMNQNEWVKNDLRRSFFRCTSGMLCDLPQTRSMRAAFVAEIDVVMLVDVVNLIAEKRIVIFILLLCR